ncbi:hypothetical protein FA09DRAFT_336039 [Tilletiopsis washingtonensis]|uniref:Nascent polypeptide-associated complex subunit alpha-like UBA domain-containing protein n=1 Tax=Tilletiopsis washingtonensis TaxID=58919 RepID=A0A316ZIS3_9BASI|nr:hypothetical protein FA09DRAFT_336039 [Tilletiopsis washingtonensis]PWO01432.1 hypothetical protein FA09DRAFT_336039 [Tilletiopsis washingtonensis]
MSKKPVAEVIQEWADADAGWSFERGRMETSVRDICFDAPAVLPAQAKAGGAAKVKKEDVDFLVDELMIPRAAAESALAADGGDVAKTLQRLVVPPPNWPQ